jgi:hypothetical protein
VANTYHLELVAEQADYSSAVINDASEYVDDDRGDKANFLVVSKNDKNGVPTYLTVLNPLPLSQVEWTFPTDLDGWYRFNLLRLTLYSASPVNTIHEIVDGDGVVTQYATVLYHTPTQQIVKAKTTGSITVQPGETGWETYWDIVSDLSTLVDYGTIQVHIHGDLVDPRLRDNLRDKLDAINSKPWSNNPFDRSKLYEKCFELQSDLNALQAMNANGEYMEMEEATRVYTEKYK